jgi:hypothetical protein
MIYLKYPIPKGKPNRKSTLRNLHVNKNCNTETTINKMVFKDLCIDGGNHGGKMFMCSNESCTQEMNCDCANEFFEGKNDLIAFYHPMVMIII